MPALALGDNSLSHEARKKEPTVTSVPPLRQHGAVSLRQLRYFTAAVRLRSLRKAAEELGITQPSLTSQIQLLEQHLNLTLLERARTGVTLTPQGREVLPYVERVLAAASLLMEAATREHTGPRGTYRLGVSATLGPYLLPYLLPDIHRLFPQIKFHVREQSPTRLIEGLLAGTFDLIITTAIPVQREIVSRPLFRESLYLVVPSEHRFAGLPHVMPSELANEEIIAIEEQHLLYQQVAELCVRFDAQLLRDFEGTSLDSVRQMVYMGLGIAFLPALYIRSEMSERPELHVTRIRGETIERTQAVLWRRNSPSAPFYHDLAEQIRTTVAATLGDTVTMLEGEATR